MQEFQNVSTRKFAVPLKPEDAWLYLQKVLHPLCRVFPDLDLSSTALEIMGKTGASFYDSLILAAAQHANCTILYSEDLRAEHRVGGVKVVNPFIPG